MAKTLVIKGANFSTNALDHVTYDGIHAESITISQASATFGTIGETLQLTYTVTPSDSTDAVLWASSDSAVASVNQNGLVTINGCGECTITVSAGSVSAVCTITVEVELTFDRYTKTEITTSNATNRITNTTDLTGSSNTSKDVFLSACIGESSFNNLMLASKDFTKLNETTGVYEMITTRQGLVDAGKSGAVRIFDHIGFPVPIVLPNNCTKIRCIAPNNHYGAYPLFYKHDVNAYPEGSGTEGSAHFNPYRNLEVTIANYSFSFQESQEFEVPSDYDSISVTWKTDGETGTVLPVNMTEAQLADFKIVAL